MAPTVHRTGSYIQTLFDCILVSQMMCRLDSNVDDFVVVSEAVIVVYIDGSQSWAQSVCHQSQEVHFQCPATSTGAVIYIISIQYNYFKPNSIKRVKESEVKKSLDKYILTS